MKCLLAVALIIPGALPMMACDLCSIYAATEAQGGTGRGFFGGVAEQYTYFNSYQVDGRDVPNFGNQYLNSSISQIFAGYNFSDRIGLQFNLPVVYRTFGFMDQRGSVSGIGDVSFIGNFCLFSEETKKFTFHWTGFGGVKFPTGDTAQLNPNREDFAPGIGGHDLTLGSGSYDGLIGTGFFARWHRLFMTGTMQYAIRTEGDFDYQFANDWTWLSGPGVYLLLNDDYTLALQAIVSGESKGQDTINGVPADDTAITAVYLGPQINFTWSNKLSAQVGADLPVSIVTTGQQIVPDYRVRVALIWHF